jgi:hypothetical protein
MIQLLTSLKEWLDMLAFSQLSRICRLTCRFISTKGFIEMVQEYTNQVQFRPSIKEKMDFHTQIEELWVGTPFPSKTIHLVVLCSL